MESEAFDIDRLLKLCDKLDGQGFGAASALLGVYDFGDGILLAIDYLPKKPEDRIPGKLRLFIPYKLLGYDGEKIARSEYWALAAKHFFTELTYRTLRYEGRPWLWMEPPGQAVLERTSVDVYDKGIEILIDFIPPIKGRRRISGGRLRRLFTDTIPRLIRELKATNKKRDTLKKMAETLEDQTVLRRKLAEEGFVAFIADGSILPREGNSDRPLKGAIPFRAPENFRYEFEVPNAGTLTGLAIESGKVVTFAGANFHGKTTIIEALMVGHYNHIPGDGREFVITVDELPLVAVENRRIVRFVDISVFMKSLPGDTDTTRFTTNEASGSTSQAVAFMEALEAGVPGVLIDEDSSAVNFLTKDSLLRRLVPEDLEPITPLLDIVKEFSKKLKLTVIFAVGALGDFIRVSDVVYLVRNYVVSDVIKNGTGVKTLESFIPPEAVKELPDEVKEKLREKEISIGKSTDVSVKHRIPDEGGIPRTTVKEYSYDEIVLNWTGRKVTIDLRGTIRKTLKERAQVRALAYAISYAAKYADGRRTLREIVDKVFEDIEREGLNIINPKRESVVLNMAMPTRYQLFYALSRMRQLKIKGVKIMS